MQRLGIRRKTLITLLGVAVPALLTFSILLIATTAHILEQNATRQVNNLAARSAVGLAELVERSRTSLTTMAATPELREYLSALEQRDRPRLQRSLQELERSFLGWQKLDSTIQAIRLIDPNGNVLLKIKEGKPIPASGPPRRPYGLPSVHSVAGRPFFRDALALPAGTILISNLERGKVEEEEVFCPAMVRFATPLRLSDDTPAGVLIVNVWGEQAGRLINRLIDKDEGNAFLIERNPGDQQRNGIYLFIATNHANSATRPAATAPCSAIIQHNAEERLRVEEQIRNTEKLASVGEMAAGLAHELNTPLGNIKALAILTRKGIEQGACDRALLTADMDDIADQAAKCSGIISGLLSFARRSEPRLGSHDPAVLVREALALVRLRAEKQQVRLHFAEPAVSPPLTVDGDQLRQVFVNLLLNGIDAAPGGSIEVGMQASDDSIALIFRDNGCGIPTEQLDRIFDPFFTTKDVGQGTGLGLSVSYGIARNLGGRIEVDSTRGQGSSFTVILPLMKGESL